MTEENIVGRELIVQLTQARISIQAVVIEKSPRAEREKEYLKNDFYQPPFVAETLKNFPAEVFNTSNLNSDESVQKLRALGPDLILLDGSVIIKPPVIASAKNGAINSHPGLLPEYRGVDSVRWSIYNNDSIGATCHFIDQGLDTGPILIRKPLTYTRDETLLKIRVRVMRACVEIMVEAVQGLIAGTLKAAPQPKEGRYYSWAPPEVKARVDAMLAQK